MSIRRLDMLELAIDQRLAEVRRDMFLMPPDNWDVEAVAVFMRNAYGRGYIDALRDKGALCTDHGFSLPAADA